MKRPYQVTGLLLVALALFFGRESLLLRYYTSLGPGPGFWGIWICLLLGLLGLAMVLQATFAKAEPMPADFLPTRTGYLRLGAVILAIVGTIVLMNPLGFQITMFGFNLFLLLALGRQNLLLTILTAIAGSWGVYILFVDWLGVPLPIGMFGI